MNRPGNDHVISGRGQYRVYSHVVHLVALIIDHGRPLRSKLVRQTVQAYPTIAVCRRHTTADTNCVVRLSVKTTVQAQLLCWGYTSPRVHAPDSSTTNHIETTNPEHHPKSRVFRCLQLVIILCPGVERNGKDALARGTTTASGERASGESGTGTSSVRSEWIVLGQPRLVVDTAEE